MGGKISTLLGKDNNIVVKEVKNAVKKYLERADRGRANISDKTHSKA